MIYNLLKVELVNKYSLSKASFHLNGIFMLIFLSNEVN